MNRILFEHYFIILISNKIEILWIKSRDKNLLTRNENFLWKKFLFIEGEKQNQD